MRKLEMLSKLHVYQKVIIVFAAMMVPVFLINIWMNVTGLSFMKKGFSSSILSNVNFYSNQLDEQLKFVHKQQLELLNDSNLQKLAFLSGQLDGFEVVQLVNRVGERLASVRYSSDYLLNVGVSIASYGKTISTQGGINKLPNPEYALISGYRLKEPQKTIYENNGRIFFVESINNGNIRVYTELSVRNLKETLSHLVELYDDSGAILTDDQFATRIAVKAKEPIVEQIKAAQALRQSDQTMDSYMLKVGHQNYMITSTYIYSLGLTLYTYMNQGEVTGPLQKFNVWLIVLSFVSLALIIIFSYSVNLMIHKPLKKLIQAFKRLETDNLIVSLQHQKDNEFGYLYQNFDRMVVKLRQSIKENYEQKIALQHSELKQLQSQINPHFLYNSFFNLYMICRSGDLESATTFAQKLGSYYEFITRSGRDEVPLAEEYRHVMDYCDIQSIRFSNRITVEASELPESCRRIEVPRLIIQPLVENAFEHAFEHGMRRGSVLMTTSFIENRLSIVVEDDGNNLTTEAILELQSKLDGAPNIPNKTGLINVGRRIQLKFGEGSGVFVSRSVLGGLKAEIRIHFDILGVGSNVPVIDRG